MWHIMLLILAGAVKTSDYFPCFFLQFVRHEAKTNTSVLCRLVQFPYPSIQVRAWPQREERQQMRSSLHQGWPQHEILFMKTAAISFAGIRMR